MEKDTIKEVSCFSVDFKNSPSKRRESQTKAGRRFMNKKTKNELEIIKYNYIQQCTTKPDFLGPVKIGIEIKSHALKSSKIYKEGSPNLKKPDADNVAKLVLDALNGLAYKDDKQIISLFVEKTPLLAASNSANTTLRVSIFYMAETRA